MEGCNNIVLQQTARLPVPQIAQTIEKYIKSAAPLASSLEMANTLALAKKYCAFV
jgi:hypothetical protein